MTDSTQEREARNYIKEVVADLETELEMYEQALTRANATIERVLAADRPVRDWLTDSMKACTACVDTRGSWRRCSYHEGADDAVDRAFESVERTILEGNVKKETVESLTAYYKQYYDEGEYSVGDLCVMLARAEVGCSALESDLARATRERDEATAAATQAIGLVEAWRPSLIEGNE